MSEGLKEKIKIAHDELDLLSEQTRKAEAELEAIRRQRIYAFSKLSKLIKEADHA